MTDQETIKKCRELWSENRRGNITDKDLEIQLAYITLENIEHYRFLMDPTAPEEVQLYHTKTKEEKERATKDGFWNEPEHYSWLEQSRMTWERNRANLATLIYVKKIIRTEDHWKVKKILLGFSDFVRKENERARMLGAVEFKKEDPRTPETMEELTEEALRASELFGGKFVPGNGDF